MTEEQKTPTDALADAIVEAVFKDNLLPEGRKAEFSKKLREGKISIGDWKFWAEEQYEPPWGQPDHENRIDSNGEIPRRDNGVGDST